jgi:hypothetical protein
MICSIALIAAVELQTKNYSVTVTLAGMHCSENPPSRAFQGIYASCLMKIQYFRRGVLFDPVR